MKYKSPWKMKIGLRNQGFEVSAIKLNLLVKEIRGKWLWSDLQGGLKFKCLRNQDSTVLTVHATDLCLIAEQASIKKQPVSIHSWHKAASCQKGMFETWNGKWWHCTMGTRRSQCGVWVSARVNPHNHWELLSIFGLTWELFRLTGVLFWLTAVPFHHFASLCFKHTFARRKPGISLMHTNSSAICKYFFFLYFL